MGRNGLPVYGENLGSAVEDAGKALELLKTNKFDQKDLTDAYVKFEKLLEEIDNYLDEN